MKQLQTEYFDRMIQVNKEKEKRINENEYKMLSSKELELDEFVEADEDIFEEEKGDEKFFLHITQQRATPKHSFLSREEPQQNIGDRPSEFGLIINRFSQNMQQLRKASDEVSFYKEKAKVYSKAHVARKKSGIPFELQRKQSLWTDMSESIKVQSSRAFNVKPSFADQEEAKIDQNIYGYGNYERMTDTFSVITHGIQLVTHFPHPYLSQFCLDPHKRFRISILPSAKRESCGLPIRKHPFRRRNERA
jgi:hypothetical protein